MILPSLYRKGVRKGANYVKRGGRRCYNRTFSYVEVLREKGIRGHRMLAKRVPQQDMEIALAGRQRCNRDELVEIIMGLVRDPEEDKSTVRRGRRDAEVGVRYIDHYRWRTAV